MLPVAASMTFITILLGCLTCGPMMDGIGRRNTLLVINTPFIIGWLLQGLAPEPVPLTILYIGRLLNGLGGGMVICRTLYNILYPLEIHSLSINLTESKCCENIRLAGSDTQWALVPLN